jgi:uncharacterized protein YcbX
MPSWTARDASRPANARDAFVGIMRSLRIVPPTTGLGVEVATGSRSWMVGDTELDDHLSRALGEPVRVRPEAAVPHFDAGAVSLVTTGTLRWCESELGVDADPRRLRANLVVGADEPFIEESWVGAFSGSARRRCGWRLVSSAAGRSTSGRTA